MTNAKKKKKKKKVRKTIVILKNKLGSPTFSLV